jgi:hypothetical protein
MGFFFDLETQKGIGKQPSKTEITTPPREYIDSLKTQVGSGPVSTNQGYISFTAPSFALKDVPLYGKTDYEHSWLPSRKPGGGTRGWDDELPLPPEGPPSEEDPWLDSAILFGKTLNEISTSAQDAFTYTQDFLTGQTDIFDVGQDVADWAFGDRVTLEDLNRANFNVSNTLGGAGHDAAQAEVQQLEKAWSRQMVGEVLGIAAGIAKSTPLGGGVVSVLSNVSAVKNANDAYQRYMEGEGSFWDMASAMVEAGLGLAEAGLNIATDAQTRARLQKEQARLDNDAVAVIWGGKTQEEIAAHDDYIRRVLERREEHSREQVLAAGQITEAIRTERDTSDLVSQRAGAGPTAEMLKKNPILASQNKDGFPIVKITENRGSDVLSGIRWEPSRQFEIMTKDLLDAEFVDIVNRVGYRIEDRERMVWEEHPPRTMKDGQWQFGTDVDGLVLEDGTVITWQGSMYDLNPDGGAKWARNAWVGDLEKIEVEKTGLGHHGSARDFLGIEEDRVVYQIQRLAPNYVRPDDIIRNAGRPFFVRTGGNAVDVVIDGISRVENEGKWLETVTGMTLVSVTDNEGMEHFFLDWTPDAP